MWSGDEEEVQPLWYDLDKVFKAWQLLTAVAKDFGNSRDPFSNSDDHFSNSRDRFNNSRDRFSDGDGSDGGSETLPETLRYDLVNTGREYLAKLSNARFATLANATDAAAVAKAGKPLSFLTLFLDIKLFVQ